MADLFVSAAGGSMPTLGSIITGIPDTGLLANRQAILKSGVATALAPTLQRLGYRTRLFCGGPLTWQRLGEFSREQGFEEVYGRADMPANSHGNEWGVDDQSLFDAILHAVPGQPTFTMIITCSYHPPFTVDLEREGFPLKAVPPELQKYPCSPEELRQFGHLWYSDRCVGEFVEKANREFPHSLFIITGDHWSRRCLNPRPTLLQRKAVPLVLVGEAISGLKKPENLVGSHLDIMPTLIELFAPAGFRYFTFGRNMFDSETSPSGFGNGAILNRKFVLDIDASHAETPSGTPLTWSREFDQLRLQSKRVTALAWWRLVRGSSLNDAR